MQSPEPQIQWIWISGQVFALIFFFLCLSSTTFYFGLCILTDLLGDSCAWRFRAQKAHSLLTTYFCSVNFLYLFFFYCLFLQCSYRVHPFTCFLSCWIFCFQNVSPFWRALLCMSLYELFFLPFWLFPWCLALEMTFLGQRVWTVYGSLVTFEKLESISDSTNVLYMKDEQIKMERDLFF